MESISFFKDLTIVELSSVLAGPSVGMFFSELGAKVYKIENSKTNGDVTRNWTVEGETELPSAYYSSINYNKEILFLNLSEEEDYNVLESLIKKADIVISNYQASVAKKLKLRYAEVNSIKEDIIFLELGGFQKLDRPAFDVVLQAETGWISMTGNGEALAKLPVALIDVIAGHQLKEAALIGIIHKLKTGKGSFINCNLEKSSLSALSNQASNFLMNDVVAKPIGTQHPNIAPYGDYFISKDEIGFVLAIGSEKHFKSLWSLLELEESTRTQYFDKNSERLKNRTLLNTTLQSRFSQFLSNQLFEAFQKEKIPFGEIKNLKEVLQGDVAQSMVLKEKIEGRNTQRLSGIAFTASFFETP